MKGRELRQVKSGIGGYSYELKPFAGILRVTPRPVEPNQQPEARVALCSGNRRDEAYTASPKAMLLSLESLDLPESSFSS